LLSVITPAYNSSTFIGETLGSVFAQTFTDFEVIAAKMARLTPNNWRGPLQPYRDSIVYIKQEKS
jgi:hypothetical protein